MSEDKFRLLPISANDDDIVNFYFDGIKLQGRKGESVASALLGNGIHMVARSFKYHRPRGIIGSGADDPAALVQIGSNPKTRMPNVRATEFEISEGLDVFSQNCWPNLKYDFGAITDFFARFISAGFYYKTFMGPFGSWMFFEKFIRAAAGLGNAPTGKDDNSYEHQNHHCDVLVIGAGPAGIIAALKASENGARVTLVDEKSSLGGSLHSLSKDKITFDGDPSNIWLEKAEETLASRQDVTILKRTTAAGYFHDNWITLWQNLQDHIPASKKEQNHVRHRLWRVRATQVIIATGALERPMLFNKNDRPGIMLAGAASYYQNRHFVLVGQDVVVFTNNNSAYRTAFELAEVGVNIVAILDSRTNPPTDLIDRARALKIELHLDAWITKTTGRHRVNKVKVRIGNTSSKKFKKLKLNCDAVLMSGGWSPNVALFSQSRGKMKWDDKIAGFRPFASWQDQHCIGGCNGVYNWDDIVTESISAAEESINAIKDTNKNTNTNIPCTDPLTRINIESTGEIPFEVEPVWGDPVKKPGTAREFVDFQNDVTTKDIRLAISEGYSSVEHLKRYTTLGMATDQGKTSSVNGFGVISRILNKPMSEVGVTTMRPPYKTFSFGAIAGQYVGDLYHPRRTTPMHACHVEANATFEIVGDWLRARVYPKDGESFDQALQRESKAARTSIGVMDASTLGKIDIKGKGAREFINRIYTNSWMKLAPGMCRYGLMLNEDGMVFDDGVTACLADDHFHMTTTTGGAARVMGWLEDYHQTEWSDLPVYFTSVTEQWAVVSVCGPESPLLMAELFHDIKTYPENLPFMSVIETKLGEIPVRIFRISFTGEVSYEINIPARYGAWLWRKIMEIGKPYDITPYGTEAMHLLRAEKGFIIAGQDTDGTVTPMDLGMSWAVKKKGDFIGKRSLSRTDTSRGDRLQLVGIRTEDPKWVAAEGSQIIPYSAEATLGNTPMIGHITSSYFSPNVGRSIALGFVKGGHSKHGETIYIARPDGSPKPAQVCAVDFLQEAQQDNPVQ